jgi:hypothetical protein
VDGGEQKKTCEMSSSSELTEEQRRRIEENRRRALELKAARERAKNQNEQPRQIDAEQLRRIEENRRRALELKAAREKEHGVQQPPLKILKPSPSQPSPRAATYPLPVCGSGQQAVTQGYNSVQQRPATQNVPPVFLGQTVLGKCILVDRQTFCVDMGYHAKAIDAFKTINSRKYGENRRNELIFLFLLTMDYRCEDGRFRVSSCVLIANPYSRGYYGKKKLSKKHLSERARCQKAIGGVDFTK